MSRGRGCPKTPTQIRPKIHSHLSFHPKHTHAQFAKTTPNGLTIKELWQFTQGQRNIMDPVGWTAMKLEWFTLYLLCADGKTHTLSKDAMRAQYDGSLFYAIAAEREKKLQEQRAQRGGGWLSWLPGLGGARGKAGYVGGGHAKEL